MNGTAHPRPVRALVVGRFQPLHKGHQAVIKQALERSVNVVVAIGSSTAKPSLRDPFTLEERKAMVLTLFPQVETYAVPDIHDAPRWVPHLLAITGAIDVVYGNDDNTLDLFEIAGVKVVRAGLVDREELEGSAIRRQMTEGDRAWRKAVPEPIVKLLDQWDVEKRLLRFASK